MNALQELVDEMFGCLQPDLSQYSATAEHREACKALVSRFQCMEDILSMYTNEFWRKQKLLRAVDYDQIDRCKECAELWDASGPSSCISTAQGIRRLPQLPS